MKWIFLLVFIYSEFGLAQQVPDIDLGPVVHGVATIRFEVLDGYDYAAVILIKNNVVVNPEVNLQIPPSRKFQRKVYFRNGPGDYKIQLGKHKISTPPDAYVIFGSGEVTAAYLPDPYLSPSTLIQSDDPSILNLSQKITTDAKAHSDLEKALAIHDWVTRNISYDVETLSQLNENPDWIDPAGQTSALSTLQTKKGLCQEYAYITIALLRAAGIRSAFVSGDASYDDIHWMVDQHAWVHAFVDNRRIEIDPTWDAGSLGTSSGSKVEVFHFSPGEKFFDPPAAEFAKTHRADQEQMMY